MSRRLCETWESESTVILSEVTDSLANLDAVEASITRYHQQWPLKGHPGRAALWSDLTTAAGPNEAAVIACRPQPLEFGRAGQFTDCPSSVRRASEDPLRLVA